MPLIFHFWSLTRDEESAKVRYAAVMLMSRVFKTCSSIIPNQLSPFIKGLLGRLKDSEQKVAAVACDCLSTLFKAMNDHICGKVKSISISNTFLCYLIYCFKQRENDARLATSVLSPFYAEVTDKLLKCTNRNSANSLLRTAAHKALRSILSICPNFDIVKTTIQTLFQQFVQVCIS